jgi:hypothetical protein
MLMHGRFQCVLPTFGLCTSLLDYFLRFLSLYLKLVDPIEYRCKDEEARAEATRELLKRIVDHRMAAKSLSAPERDAVSYLTIFLCVPLLTLESFYIYVWFASLY